MISRKTTVIADPLKCVRSMTFTANAIVAVSMLPKCKVLTWFK
ncbi:hypothetical protein BCW_A0018 [Bacillus cereus W]|nr:hypothetical protein BCW_A0018 [Bacillus cereus W]